MPFPPKLPISIISMARMGAVLSYDCLQAISIYYSDPFLEVSPCCPPLSDYLLDEPLPLF